MYWTLELASKLTDAPFPCTKKELLDYAERNCLLEEVIENLQELEDDVYDEITDIWEDYPLDDDDFLMPNDEY